MGTQHFGKVLHFVVWTNAEKENENLPFEDMRVDLFQLFFFC